MNIKKHSSCLVTNEDSSLFTQASGISKDHSKKVEFSSSLKKYSVEDFCKRVIKVSFVLMGLALSGCAGLSGQNFHNADVFYERKAAIEDECKDYARNLYPGYPARRGVLTNFNFTHAYDQCLTTKKF